METKKTLQNVLSILGPKDFNDLIATLISGDEEFLHDSLIHGKAITSGPNGNYIEMLAKEGYNIGNFPYEELRAYTDRVTKYLSNNLILDLL